MQNNGEVSDSEYDHYVGLIELGALDEYDHIKNGDFRYIILTEDSSIASRKYLRGVLEASGFGSREFQIYSYNGVDKIESAKMFAQFLLDLNPNLTIIIYRDRDGLYDAEVEDIKSKIEFNDRVKCVIARYNDIEMYYCNAEHIVSICQEAGFALEPIEAAALIAEAIAEAEADSRQKFYNHRIEIARKTRADQGAAIVTAEASFQKNGIQFAYGKKVAGLLKSKLQLKFGENIDIHKPTSQVFDSQFSSICCAA